MRIKKILGTVGLVGNVLNKKSISKKDAYSCDYINKLNTYSTEEQIIGTWINGKPLYRKVVSGKFGTITDDVESTLEIPIANADFVLTKYFWVDRPNEKYINQGPVSGTIDYSYTSFSSTQAVIRFKSKASWVSDKNIYVIVEYTKTTD